MGGGAPRFKGGLGKKEGVVFLKEGWYHNAHYLWWKKTENRICYVNLLVLIALILGKLEWKNGTCK